MAPVDGYDLVRALAIFGRVVVNFETTVTLGNSA